MHTHSLASWLRADQALEKGVDPNEYDALACLSGSIYCPEKFEAFCAEFGYDEDSRIAEATFHNCRALSADIVRFFSKSALEELSQIQ